MVDSSLAFGIIALSGILVSVLYWIRKTLLTGIVSILLMFGAGFYWLVLQTSLPELAWLWIGIALANVLDFMIRTAYTMGDQLADRFGDRFDFLRSRRQEDDQY